MLRITRNACELLANSIKENPIPEIKSMMSETLYNNKTSDFLPIYLLPNGAVIMTPETNEKINIQITVNADSDSVNARKNARNGVDAIPGRIIASIFPRTKDSAESGTDLINQILFSSFRNKFNVIKTAAYTTNT